MWSDEWLLKAKKTVVVAGAILAVVLMVAISGQTGRRRVAGESPSRGPTLTAVAMASTETAATPTLAPSGTEIPLPGTTVLPSEGGTDGSAAQSDGQRGGREKLSMLIAGLLTLSLGFILGWLAAWVAVVRSPGASPNLPWGRVLAGAGAVSAILFALALSPLVDLSQQPEVRATVVSVERSTWTPYPTHTPYATYTAYPTQTPQPTHTAYPTYTPLPTSTSTSTLTPTRTKTPTRRPTTTPTARVEAQATESPTPHPTDTPTSLPTGTSTATPTPRPTETATASPQPTTTPTRQAKAMATSQPTGTPTSPATSTAASPLTKTPTRDPNGEPTATLSVSGMPTTGMSANETLVLLVVLGLSALLIGGGIWEARKQH